jgi:hypothetical protein
MMQTHAAFELRIVPGPDRRYSLALWQRAIPANGKPESSERRLVTLSGVPLQVSMDQVLDALRKAGHRSTALGPKRAEPLPVNEEIGVRLGLLFLALKPLTKVGRMEQIAAGLRVMPSEEAYYWFSKCAPSKRGGHARKALRVLLSGD